MISSHFPDKYLAQALAKHRFKLNRVWISAFLHSWKGLVFVFCFDKKIKANLEVEQVGIQDRTRNIPAASLGLCWGRIPTFTSSSPFRGGGALREALAACSSPWVPEQSCFHLRASELGELCWEPFEAEASYCFRQAPLVPCTDSGMWGRWRCRRFREVGSLF